MTRSILAGKVYTPEEIIRYLSGRLDAPVWEHGLVLRACQYKTPKVIMQIIEWTSTHKEDAAPLLQYYANEHLTVGLGDHRERSAARFDEIRAESEA